MKSIYEWILSFFHREVDDIVTPIKTMITRIEAFEQRMLGKASLLRADAAKAANDAMLADNEAHKAAVVGAKLSELVK